MDYTTATALPIAGITAYEGIVKNLNVKAGDKVLIQGGAGGVGLFSVQIAKALGANVATTASPSHNDLLESLGVDVIIVYNKQSADEVIHDFEYVFYTAGDVETGIKVLKDGGKLVTVGGQPTPEQLALPNKEVMFQFTNATTKELVSLAEMVNDGKVKVEITPLEFTQKDVQAAHEVVQSRHTTGKIVINIEK